MCAMLRLLSWRWFLRLMPLLVIAPAALLLGGGGAVDAQDELPPIADIRDLSVTLATDHANSFYVYVYNHSTIPMRNVQVRLTTDPPEALARLGAGSGEEEDSYNRSSGIITFSLITPPAHRGYYPASAQIYHPPRDALIAKVRAEIIGSVPAEDATRRDNNQAEHWVHFSASGDFSVRSNTSISVDVVNRSPAQGENHVFSVNALQVTPDYAETENLDVDVAVKVALSEGLAFASGPSATSGTSFSRTSPTTGVWRLGRGARVTGQLKIPVQLSPGAVPPLNRRCLSAQIVGGRPAATEHEHGRVHTTCLGARKPLVISGGNVHIGLRTCRVPVLYPCREGETLIMAALVEGSPYRSEDVIFLVDPVAHQSEGTHDSLTWSWSTGHTLACGGHNDCSLPGVKLVRPTASRTHGKSRKFTISWDLPLEERPGTIAELYRWYSGGNVKLDLGLNPDSKLVDTIGDTRTPTLWTRLVVFSAPGVYKVILGKEFTRRSDNIVFKASAPFTYVVGTIADLQVHDAGRHGRLPEGQQAYTLRAENNLDATAEQVEVALAGVPREAIPEVSSDGGSYDRGACDENDLCEGIWKIGDLESREYRHLSGRSDGPTLTLLVNGDDPKPITATITSEQTQTVTAGGNSYTIKVIDIDDSNSKDVSVAVGTGRGERDPEAPVSLRVDRLGAIALLRWDTVEKVSRWPVAHYQVERDNRVLDVEPKEAMYLDLRERGGNSVYRVRAVSEPGLPGPWSRPAGGTDVLAQTAGLGAPNGLTATPGVGLASIHLSWFAPSGETGLSYRVEHALDGAGPWRSVITQSGTTYSHSHSSLLPGTTHYYRVATVKGSDISAWAYVQATMPAAPTVDSDGEPVRFDPPLWPENLRFTSIDRTAVTLAWDPPANDGGSRITGYEYRVAGPCPSGADDVCDIVAPRRVSGTSVRITGLNREGTYQFEVRALNAAGAGDWSQSISKEVGPATAGGGRVILSPSRLTVAEGGEATYRVKLSREPTLPIAVFMHWNLSGTEDEALGSELPFQQGQVLLPTGYGTSGMSENCHGYNYQDPKMTHAWNTGVPIMVKAPEDDERGNGRLTILHDLTTVSAECLGMTEEEWSPDPVYDGMFGLALEVTERDND